MCEYVDKKYKHSKSGVLSIELTNEQAKIAFLVLRNKNSGNILKSYGISKITSCNQLPDSLMINGALIKQGDKHEPKIIRVFMKQELLELAKVKFEEIKSKLNSL